jgi:DNA-binding transcriptional regulator YhcF (GntR family)
MTRPYAHIQAMRHLQQIIPELQREGNRTLPAIKTLASAVKISHLTMHKAVTDLAQWGVLEIRQGSRCRITENRKALNAFLAYDIAAMANVRWKAGKVQDLIIQDILAGTFAPGGYLPPSKEMTIRYGVCHRTLMKALSSLVADKRLEYQRKRFLVPRIISARRGNTIVLFSHGYADGALLRYSPWEQDQFRMLERDCSQAGLNLHVVPCYFHNQEMTYPGAGKNRFGILRANDPSILGSILFANVMPPAFSNDLLDLLMRFGKPLSVLNAGQNTGRRIAHAGKAVTLFFSQGLSAKAGEDVGRYLLKLGHRHVAFLSTTADSAWSQDRLAGLTRALGQGCTVRAFTESVSYPSKTIVESSPGIQKHLTAASSIALNSIAVPEERRQTTDYVKYRLLTRLRELYDIERHRARILQVLEQAIGFSEATAWVGAYDLPALHAVDFLRQRGRRVPRDISVIGFDDSIEASFHRLTSFNFNGDAVMRAMLRHIVDPARNRDLLRDGNSPVEIPGFITVRQTTGPAAT